MTNIVPYRSDVKGVYKLGTLFAEVARYQTHIADLGTGVGTRDTIMQRVEGLVDMFESRGHDPYKIRELAKEMLKKRLDRRVLTVKGELDTAIQEN